MTTIPDIEIQPLEPHGPLFEGVIRLYRKHSGTLGFLPRGAFEQYADDGGVLVAHADVGVAGYVAFRLAGDRAVLVHLCVDTSHRGRGLGEKLVAQMLRETAHVAEVRLSCRREYPANRLWPACGFTIAGERTGRGKDGAVLLVWRRLNQDDTPLLSRAREEERGDRVIVAVDANVFVDFGSEGATAEESRCLLADWLQPEIDICVTAELSTELDRQEDPEVRARRRTRMRTFHTLEATGAAFDETLPKVEALLPPPTTSSDHSDRRQLAQAIAGNAGFFVTRDGTLLGHARTLTSELGIRVVRPVDLVSQIHSRRDPDSYAPSRLVGTRIHKRAPISEAELRPFQRFAQSEPKSDFLTLCRRVLAEPSRYWARLFSPPEGEPIFLCAVDRCTGPATSRIVIARSLSHRLSATLLRRVLAEELLPLEHPEVRQVWCDDLADPLVEQVLEELGFRPTGNGLLKMSIRGLVRAADLPSIVASRVVPLPVPGSDEECCEAERRFWPLKLSDAPLPSYIVPIQPSWAAQLFDAELGDQDLFGSDMGLALALENVYYSRSPIRIPEGARILWYVSKSGQHHVHQIRACSLAVGTVRGAARAVYRAHRRLGVFQWRDVLRLAHGKPDERITAYRFAFTERFPSPVSFARVQEVLRAHKGSGNQLAGPVAISQVVFNALYSEAGLADC